MKVRDIIKMVEADGWRMVSQAGSHRQYEHPTKKGKVTVAGHPSDETPTKTLKDLEEYSGAGGVENKMKYLIIYEKSSTGYGAYAPDLPGCIAVGRSLEETAELMRGAIAMHLKAMREDGDPIPKPTSLADYLEAPAA